MVDSIVGVIIMSLVHLGLGAGLSWLFYSFRKKDLLGGFTGGLIVGVLGTILGGFILSNLIEIILGFLQKNFTNVNIVAALIGGYASLHIYNKINHDKKRKDY